MYKALAFAGIAALGLTGQAFAAESSGISYNYLEANYVTADIDGVSSNPDGFGINGSIGFSPMFHGFVDYNNLDFSGTTIQTWEVGLGLNHSLTPKLDLVGRLGYVKAQIEGAIPNDDGFGLQAGVRARPTANFEIDGLLHYTDLDDAGDDTALKVAARYFFMPQFSVGAGLEYDDDDTVWNLGVRWNFSTGR